MHTLPQTSPVAQTLARLDRTDFVRAVPLANNLGYVLHFLQDKGLRALGQFSLVNACDNTYGLVVAADGSIPRDAQAQSLLNAHNAAARTAS